MPSGRVCAGEGCQTRLSVYNRDDVCSSCERSGAPIEVAGSA